MDDSVNYKLKLLSPVSKALLYHAGIREGNQQLRRSLLNFFDPIVPPKSYDNVYVEDLQVPITHVAPNNYRISVRIFAPAGFMTKKNSLPLMIWCHGGGYAIGSPFAKTTDAACRNLAKVAEIIIVSVGM